MTGLEKARKAFQEAGLVFPQIPEELASRLEEREEWVFSTREAQMCLHDIDGHVSESYDSPAPYAMLGNAGYSINSYVLAYYLVFGPLRLFLNLSWGGKHMSSKRNAAEIQQCFSLADEILHAAMTTGKLKPDERLTIVCSRCYCHWGLSLPGDSRISTPAMIRPSEFLAKILRWLKNPKARRSRSVESHAAG